MNTVRDKIDAIPVQDQKPNNIGRKILYTAASGLLAIALLTGCDRSDTGGDPDTTDTDNETGNNAPVNPADEQPGSGSNPDGTGAVQPNGSGNGGGGTGSNNDPANVISGDTVTIVTPLDGEITVRECDGEETSEAWRDVSDFVYDREYSVTARLNAMPGTACATEGGNVFVEKKPFD